MSATTDMETGELPLGRRWTAADQVYSVLERMVIGGAFQPGDRITELSLASRLNVSRTPLRQALEKLVSKGWMRRSTSGALHVVDVSEEEIEALYAVRAALEELLIRQAAGHMGEADLAELRRQLEGQLRAASSSDADQVSRHGEEFHRVLWRLSGNLVATQFLEEVLQRTTRYRRLSFSEPYRFHEGVKQHRELLDALARNDVDKASRIIRRHIDESRQYVLQAFRSWRAPETPPRLAKAARSFARDAAKPVLGKKASARRK